MAVTVDMIAVALGVATPSTGSRQEQQWNLFISDAEMLIETRRLELEADPVDTAKVDYVVRQAVVDHVRHPDDATQVTVSVDDASTSKTYRSGRGLVAIRDEWWTLLGLGEGSGGAFALDLGASYVVTHANVCSLNFGALYCSCGADIAGFPIFEVDA
jgi:hypothetical protein